MTKKIKENGACIWDNQKQNPFRKKMNGGKQPAHRIRIREEYLRQTNKNTNELI
jgi:hypothetical protein